MKTEDVSAEHEHMVKMLAKSGDKILATLHPLSVDLWHGCTGVATESGELLDAAKRYCVYNKSVDLVNVIEELGDIEFYLAMVRNNIGVSRADTLRANISKLSSGPNARYKSGYSDAAAIERADKK